MPTARHRRPLAAIASTAIVGAVVVLVVHLTAGHGPPAPPSCTVAATGSTGAYVLAPEQAQNAAIIAAAALQKGLPDHAVTVALATSLQETHLENLPYGDLDSVGLFQQRPSQGWGTPAQLLDPTYAAGAFYLRLVQIPGWETMPVTQAAQLVQHSAAPTAYAVWESEARAVAQALTGEVAAGLTCRFAQFSGAPPAPSALTQAGATEMGSSLLATPVSTKVGWQVAAWAVAHAYAYHLRSVSFAGRTWTYRSGSWSPSAGSGVAGSGVAGSGVAGSGVAGSGVAGSGAAGAQSEVIAAQ